MATAGVATESGDYLEGNIGLEILLERSAVMVVIHSSRYRLYSYRMLSIATLERIERVILSLMRDRDLFPLQIYVKSAGQLAFQNTFWFLPIALFHNSVHCDA